MVAEPGSCARMGRVFHGMLVFVVLIQIRVVIFLLAVRLLCALLLRLLPTGAVLLVEQEQRHTSLRDKTCQGHSCQQHKNVWLGVSCLLNKITALINATAREVCQKICSSAGSRHQCTLKMPYCAKLT